MKMLIDGQWVDASDGNTKDIVNAADGSFIDTVPQSTLADIEHAVKAAQEGKERMARMPAHRRAAILIKVSELMQQKHEALSELLARENGKTHRETRGEVSAAIRIVRGYGEEAKRLFGKVTPMSAIPGLENDFAYTVYQPLGVVAAIVPFNYPAELWSHKMAAGLAAGNAVITKPPKDCPLTLMKIAELMEEAGLPRAAHQIVSGPGAVIGDYLAASPDVQYISMTGSTAVGQTILQRAASTLKKVHLELGGNDATIVCQDADIELAVNAAIGGRFIHGNGQICCAVKRVLVHKDIIDEYTGLLLTKTANLKMGDQMQPDTDVGPLTNEEAAIEVEESIQAAVAAGATMSIGGKRNGCFVEPTVFTGVTRDMEVFKEEIFGPVIPVIPFETLQEAVEIANDSNYGLQAAVFTKDMKTAMDIAHRLEVGTVQVNSPTGTCIRIESLPFGGVKQSGNGREGFHITLQDMSEEKTVVLRNCLSIYDQE
jgi:acyl-CoA reductase-like NAD-dependent aldehyde dehydrogenase